MSNIYKCNDYDEILKIKEKLYEATQSPYSAYVGPNIWDKPLSFSELNILESSASKSKKHKKSTETSIKQQSYQDSSDSSDDNSDTSKSRISDKLNFMIANCDASKIKFPVDELQLKPFYSKATKKYVETSEKDVQYWKKRIKNNMAARKSRATKRQKENQVTMRARYLEEENDKLRNRVQVLLKENQVLKSKLGALDGSGDAAVTDDSSIPPEIQFMDEFIANIDELLE